MWAITANADLPERVRTQLSMLNMATYQGCVLLWCCYFLVPSRVTIQSAPTLPENNLELWNRELERLLQQ
jgi:hypothetical protein